MKKIKIESFAKNTSLRAPKGRSNLFLGLLRPSTKAQDEVPSTVVGLRRKEDLRYPPRNDGWKAIICTLIISISFTGTSYARATVESLSQVEKMFMQCKYDRVVSESGKLIDAGAHGREELFYLKGLSQTQLARFREARQTFEYMVQRYPKGKRAFDGYIGIGDAYLLEGKYAESISSYNDALTNYPGHKNASIGYYKIGSAYLKLGSEEKAKEYFDKVKNGSPLSFESKMIPKDLGSSSASIGGAVNSFFKHPSEESGCSEDYFYVQAGYFKSRNNAEGLTEKLKRKGYDSYLAALIKNSVTFYKVKVGRFKTRREAEAQASSLKSDGYKTRVCR
ncbi:MAG: SPOR domain-containing protein [Candidatus Omnitrophica bacterium]|nr:SPOR domain-containing protein [Candidatus Omnitrophota bacterium]